MKVENQIFEITGTGNTRTAEFTAGGKTCNLFDYPLMKEVLVNLKQKSGETNKYSIKYILKENTETSEKCFIYLEFNKKVMHLDTSLCSSVLPDFVTSKLTDPNELENYHLLFHKGAIFNHKAGSKGNEDHDFLNFITDGVQQPYWPEFPKGIRQKVDFSAIIERQKQQIFNLGLQVKSMPMASPTNGFPRLIVGLGNESVYENSLTLHHIYGIPYIPGSAIKGITRGWIISECYAGDEKEAFKNDELLRYLFGTGGDGNDGGNQGKAYFFDAFPTAVPTIEPDIMNNHFQSYYDGNTPPADWINPNPVFFLTVKEGKFCFHVGIRENKTITELITDEKLKTSQTRLFNLPEGRHTYTVNNTILEILTAWVKDALEHHGIGAKTAVGYGRMK